MSVRAHYLAITLALLLTIGPWPGGRGVVPFVFAGEAEDSPGEVAAFGGDAFGLADRPTTPGARDAADEGEASWAGGILRGARHYTVGSFPRRVLDTGVEAFTGRSLIALALAGASVPLLASHLDGDARTETGRHPRQRYFVGASEVAGATGTLLAVSAVGILGGQLVGSDDTVRTGTTLLEALTVTGVTTEALKASVRRERPDGSDRLSFPSGHASASFTAATVLAGRYGPWVGVPAYLTAGAIGLSRVEADRHFLSDVVFGATLGTVIGYSALDVREREAPGARSVRPTARWSVAPYSQPGGVGVAVTRPW